MNHFEVTFVSSFKQRSSTILGRPSKMQYINIAHLKYISGFTKEKSFYSVVKRLKSIVDIHVDKLHSNYMA